MRDPINPSPCIAIEDSHWGLEAARKAGLRCVAVTNTYPAAELECGRSHRRSLSDLTVSKVEALIREDPRGKLTEPGSRAISGTVHFSTSTVRPRCDILNAWYQTIS